jgi:murein DD-endopeptidase MepM/ murein hydrolase activator NlpD
VTTITPKPVDIARMLTQDTAYQAQRECVSVALAALRHAGKSYLITRELDEDYIDCSTIVSQAHWEGAAVQTPFIAETQRLAPSATAIASLDEIMPGDILIAYPSKEASPGGRHNHVALFLCGDPSGEAWAIEAREETGTMIIGLGTISHDGGIRRFCPNPDKTFAHGAWHDLALRVPKLGRLGARLTASYLGTRRHTGTDVYASPGSVVSSPADGEVVSIGKRSGLGISVEIGSAPAGISMLLAPLVVSADISVGQRVRAGDPLGRLDGDRRYPGCNAIPGRRGLHPLHWELWSDRDLGYPLTPGLSAGGRIVSAHTQASAYSPVYPVKTGVLRTPLPGVSSP